MYQRYELGGSIADRLKVAKPDEFDTDIVLKLPRRSSIQITKCISKKDFIQIRLMNNKVNSELEILMDNDGYLLQNEVFWI